MKHQYQWLNDLINKIPALNINFTAREECDDEYVAYEGGHGHGKTADQESDYEDDKDPEADKKLYATSMAKLKLVSSVSVFFIIA